MGHEDRSPAAAAADVIERALETAAALARTVVTAGLGLVSVAVRVARLAEERLEILWGRQTGTARDEPAPWARDRSTSSSAVAFDAEAVPRPEAKVAAESVIAEPATTSRSLDVPPLPDCYGGDRVSALARDPDTIFVWWEVSDATRAHTAQGLTRAGGDDGIATPQEALEVTPLGDPLAGGSWRVPLPPFARSWYVAVPRTAQRFRVALGLLAEGGFTPLAPPIIVETPAIRPSSAASMIWRRFPDPEPIEPPELPPAPDLARLWDDRRGLPTSGERSHGRHRPELPTSPGPSSR
jgi:hypothetical protein